MKNFFSSLILTIALILHGTIRTFAGECNFWMFDFWPKNQTIAPNSIIVIEWYGQFGEDVNTKNAKRSFFLQAGENEIPLDVIERFNGFERNQIIFRPVRDLTPGQIYELRVHKLPGCIDENKSLEAFNYKTNKYEEPFWQVTASADKQAPKWENVPKFKDLSIGMTSVGISRFANYSAAISDASECLLLTSIKDTKSGKTHRFCVPLKDGLIRVGSNPCFRFFYLERDIQYEISFDIMDASGNVTPWKDDKLKLKLPKLQPNEIG